VTRSPWSCVPVESALRPAQIVVGGDKLQRPQGEVGFDVPLRDSFDGHEAVLRPTELKAMADEPSGGRDSERYQERCGDSLSSIHAMLRWLGWVRQSAEGSGSPQVGSTEAC
jgi:hypothetical protein